MLHLNVITPEKILVKEDVFSVTVPAKMGEMQILPGHIGLLSEILAGEISYENAQKQKITVTIGPGVLEVESDKINILCERP